MTIPVIDLHCDVLFKMAKDQLPFRTGTHFDASYANLVAGNVRIQAFAIFVMPDWSMEKQLKSALEQYTYFQQSVVGEGVVHLKSWAQFDTLQPGEVGAFLTLEGVGYFEDSAYLWHIFREMGVLNIGMTWNAANALADGADEDLGRGVTPFGKNIIEWNNEAHIFTDVSHLTERAFWDVMDYAKYPIATHSNAAAVHPHVRNLTDAQIQAMIAKQAPIHVLYYPTFLTTKAEATIADVVKHIDHIASLGAVHLIGLGSDFDGIDAKVKGLETAAHIQNLLEALSHYYTDEQVRGFAYQNFLNHRPK